MAHACRKAIKQTKGGWVAGDALTKSKLHFPPTPSLKKMSNEIFQNSNSGNCQQIDTWVPEAFYARFPVSVTLVSSAEDVSACYRRSFSSYARKNLWYLGHLIEWIWKITGKNLLAKGGNDTAKNTKLSKGVQTDWKGFLLWLYKRKQGLINLKKIETDFYCGFGKLVDLSVFQCPFLLFIINDDVNMTWSYDFVFQR